MRRKEKASAAKAFDRAGAGLISFSAVASEPAAAGATASPAANAYESPAYTGTNATLSMLFRKAAKRDPTTRVKAFQELAQFLQFPSEAGPTPEQVAEVRGLVGHLVYLYVRMCFDSDRQVRSALNNLLKHVVLVDKRSLGPHMQALIGPWRMAMCDPFLESARHATEAFKNAIPPKKRRQVLLYLSTPALSYLNEKMRAQLGSLSDPYGAEDPAPEVVEERYERVVSSAMLALARLMEDVLKQAEGEEESKAQELKDGVRDEASGQAVGLMDVLDEEVFRRARDPRPPIRQAAYELITVLSRNAPFCLESIPAARLGNHIAQFTREKHLPCMEKMMVALLALVRAYPQLWESADICKVLLPSLVGQVKARFHGNAAAADLLLPLVAVLPNHLVSVHTEQGLQFIIPLLQEQWTVTTSTQSRSLNLDTLELCTFALLREAKSGSVDSAVELAPLPMLEQTLRHLVSDASQLPQLEANRVVSALRQLHRAAARDLVMSASQWNERLWTPLTLGVLEDVMLPRQDSKKSITPGSSPIESFVSVINAPFFGDNALEFTASTGLATVLEGFFVAATAPATDSPDVQATSSADLVSQLQWACAACTGLLPWLAQAPVATNFLQHGSKVHEHSHSWCRLASVLIERADKQRAWGVHAMRCIVAFVKAFAESGYSTPALLQDWLEAAVSAAATGQRVLTSAVVLTTCTPETASSATLERLRDAVLGWIGDETRTDVPKQKHIVALGYQLALAMPDFAQQLLDAARQHASKAHVWILLSLSKHTEHACHAAIHEYVLTDLLHTAFLSRLRDEKDAKQMEDAKFIEETVGCVLTWVAVEHILLPSLDDTTRRKFTESVCGTLSQQLSAALVSKEGTEPFNTNKWCPHIARLMSLRFVDSMALLIACGALDLANYKSITTTAQLAVLVEVLDRLSTQLECHESLQALVLQNAELALWVVGTILTAHAAAAGAESHASLLSNLSTDAVSLWSMLYLPAAIVAPQAGETELPLDAIDRLHGQFVAAVAAADAEQLARQITEAVVHEVAQAGQSAAHLLTVVRAWQFVLYQLLGKSGDHDVDPYRLFSSSSAQLVLDTIPPGETAAQDDTVWYIDSNAELQQATVLRVHREGVVEPYYTIQMQQDPSRELQTEAHRLLRAAPTAGKQQASVARARLGGAATEELLSVLDRGSGLIDPRKHALLRATLLEQASQGYFDFGPVRSALTESILHGAAEQAHAALFEIAALSHYHAFMDDALWVLTKLSSWIQSYTERRKAGSGTVEEDVTFLAVLASVCEKLRCSRFDLLALEFVEAADIAADAHACIPMLLNSIICHVMGLRLHQFPGLLLCSASHPALNVATIAKFVWVKERVGEVVELSLSARSAEAASRLAQFGGEFGVVVAPFVFDLMLCKAFVAMKQLDETWAVSLLRVGTHDPVTQVEDGLIECIISTAAPVAARLTAASVAVSLAKETTMHRVTIMGTVSEESKEEDLTADEAHDANAFELLMGNELASVLRAAFNSSPHDRQSDAIGELLSWALCMAKVDVLAVHNGSLRARVGTHLRKCGVFDSAMDLFLPLLPDVPKIFPNLSAMLEQTIDLVGGDHRGFDQLVAFALFATVRSLPAMSRTWWSDTPSRHLAAKLLKFVEQRVSPALIEREVHLVELAANRWDTSEFTVRGNRTTREITAAYVKDEITIEMTVKLQASYPLKNVEVDCSSRLGIAEKNWRRWVLQIVQLLSMQDGSVVDAVLLWKGNVDREMEGVEPCPICYSTLHPKSHSLPSLACRTCNNKFHRACLYKWFQTSGKSKCVLCQQPFFSTYS